MKEKEVTHPIFRGPSFLVFLLEAVKNFFQVAFPCHTQNFHYRMVFPSLLHIAAGQFLNSGYQIAEEVYSQIRKILMEEKKALY